MSSKVGITTAHLPLTSGPAAAGARLGPPAPPKSGDGQRAGESDPGPGCAMGHGDSARDGAGPPPPAPPRLFLTPSDNEVVSSVVADSDHDGLG
jgi:hypothetical protein